MAVVVGQFLWGLRGVYLHPGQENRSITRRPLQKVGNLFPLDK